MVKTDEIERPGRSPLDLSIEELEECVDGSFYGHSIIQILTKPGVIDQYGWVDPENFADWFASSLEDMSGEEEDTEAWTKAFDINWNWGYDTADNINAKITKDNNET